MKAFIIFIFLQISIAALSQNTLVYINEIVASNGNILKDRYNQYSDFIEIYNAGNEVFNLADCYITNDINDLTKCRISNKNMGLTAIQPKTFKILWMDENTSRSVLNVCLKLSSNPKDLILVAPDGKTIIDKVSYPEQRYNVSYGRKKDNFEELGYFLKPTPNAANNTKMYKGFCSIPEFSEKGGFYNSLINVKIKHDKDAIIYYTLDGTEPNSNSLKYKDAISIDKTTLLRIKVEQEQYISSEIISQTYFINENFTLPVFSITTNNFDMFASTDPKKNIYTERKINIEYFDRDKSAVFSTNAGVKLVGKAIRNYPQKSMSVRLRSSYGLGTVKCKLFDDKEKSKYSAFLLRNSGNDNAQTLFKDALMHRLVNGTTHIDCQGYTPTIVYINGNCWGINNLREKISKHYIGANHPKVDMNNIDMMEWNSRPIQGDDVHYKNMIKFISENDMKLKENYDSVLTMIDLDNFVDYQIAEIFYANTDWPMANMKFWRPHTKDGKWRWILFDTDLAFDRDKQRCKGHHNSLDYALGVNNCHLPHLTKSLTASTIMLRKLMENEEFKSFFVSRFCDLLNTIFTSEHIANTISDIKSTLEPEIDKHIERWSDKRGIKSRQSWDNNIAKLIRFANERPDTIRYFINSKFNLGGSNEIKLDISEPSFGKLKINTLEINSFPFTGKYFARLPITIEAIPNEGYKFVKWSDGNKDAKREVLVSEVQELIAIFK